MELIDQHTKKIMEGCKKRARDAGLIFDDESLEYTVTNRDLIELSPKVMIPTLYDYWVHDVEVLKGQGKYDLYPSNPYETVINTRPAISFYNDNNPDWLNVMIFYHVLGHIDFFQNNQFFANTRDDDFAGKALSDKRLIAKLRAEKGSWAVDYVIEWARGIDNIVNYHKGLELIRQRDMPAHTQISEKLNYFFDFFLSTLIRERVIKESLRSDAIDSYNEFVGKKDGEKLFFDEMKDIYPEFEKIFENYRKNKRKKTGDLLEFLIEFSPHLNKISTKEDNTWKKQILQVVRNTSLFFQPQIRTKIMNEGWASYWHENLFLADNRIKGHEVDFARINAGVTAMPKVGLNPYALGMRLFYHIEDMANKGKYGLDFLRILDEKERKDFDAKTGKGRDFIFKIREELCDSMFIDRFIEQDFMRRHKLFVAGKRLNRMKGVWEYYIKSRLAEKYKEMVLKTMYHPPRIMVNERKTFKDGILHLEHKFEGKPLIREFIHNTMIGIEQLWGKAVNLSTWVIANIDREKRFIEWGHQVILVQKKKINITSSTKEVNFTTDLEGNRI